MAAGITQQELADRTGYTHEYIRRIKTLNRKGGFTIECINIIVFRCSKKEQTKTDITIIIFILFLSVIYKYNTILYLSVEVIKYF